MRILAPLLVALVATAPLTPAPAQAQTPAAASPHAVIKLLPWRNRWVMEAEIGGKVRKFLLEFLGGPLKDMQYMQVLTSGFRIVLEFEGATYAYHSGAGQDPFYCARPETPAPSPTPLD